MCRVGVLWRFAADEAIIAIGHRRQFVGTLRSHQGWAVDEYAASVVFSELVGNVVTHSPGPIEIVLECDNQEIVLKVTDRGVGFRFSPSLPRNVLSEGGRGLLRSIPSRPVRGRSAVRRRRARHDRQSHVSS
jgi:anti-sigma regulatory factor (Ser/Thr protein kinase)